MIRTLEKQTEAESDEPATVLMIAERSFPYFVEVAAVATLQDTKAATTVAFLMIANVAMSMCHYS
jgi:hypothetical protein